jgi:hypothetical protein
MLLGIQIKLYNDYRDKKNRYFKIIYNIWYLEWEIIKKNLKIKFKFFNFI